MKDITSWWIHTTVEKRRQRVFWLKSQDSQRTMPLFYITGMLTTYQKWEWNTRHCPLSYKSLKSSSLVNVNSQYNAQAKNEPGEHNTPPLYLHTFLGAESCGCSLDVTASEFQSNLTHFWQLCPNIKWGVTEWLWELSAQSLKLSL